jgi:hypothetical protein
MNKQHEDITPIISFLFWRMHIQVGRTY